MFHVGTACSRIAVLLSPTDGRRENAGMVAPDWSSIVLGIDVGQSRLHAIAESNGATALAVAYRGSEETGTAWVGHVIGDWIGRYNPDLVVVDAPSGWGHDPRGKWGRLCEMLTTEYVDGCWRSANGDVPPTALARFGIAWTPRLGSKAVPGWMVTGFAVYDALSALGYPLAVGGASVSRVRRAAIECYPDAAFWVLAAAASRDRPPVSGPRAPLARKRHARAAAIAEDRLRLLPGEIRTRLEQHPDFPSSATARIDFIDAACAALTGLLALRGKARCVSGRAGEGAIWLPE
jgi:hypothetical protein